ncbi:hypothetical protein [Pedobacter ureilyticus]|uniref:Uncharacterized protein n=1 Tax=Pedobacter ureilyticus TaxID=1393051 RepID=A0ABW9J2K4_9SPHI|nr:hypothetical protein [Pedobacter helvus]
MVEIFKTNVGNHRLAQQLIDEVRAIYNNADISFDLEDCDRVFRFYADEDVAGIRQNIDRLFQSMGCFAIPLDDEFVEFKSHSIFSQVKDKVGIKAFLGFI